MSFVNSIPSTVIVISITVSGEHMEVQRSLDIARMTWHDTRRPTCARLLNELTRMARNWIVSPNITHIFQFIHVN
jgi:hypothetical protein